MLNRGAVLSLLAVCVCACAMLLAAPSAAAQTCPVKVNVTLDWNGPECSKTNPCPVGSIVTVTLMLNGQPYAVQSCETMIMFSGSTDFSTSPRRTVRFDTVGTSVFNVLVQAPPNGPTNLTGRAVYVANGIMSHPARVDVSETAGFATVHLHTTQAPTSVNYQTVDDTAKAGRNFTAVSSGVTFAAGEFDKDILIPILDNTSYDGDVTFGLLLTAPTNGILYEGDTTRSVAYVPITVHDDDVPTIDFNGIFPRTVSESAGDAAIEVRRTGDPQKAVSVPYTIDSVSAGTINFAAGETSRTIAVPVPNDNVWQTPRTRTITLTTPTGGVLAGNAASRSVMLNVIDDDAVPVVVIGNASVREGDSGDTALTFPITLTQPLAGALTLTLATHDKTATAPSDYTAVSGATLVFAPGETSKTFAVTVKGDTDIEADETFSLSADVSGYGAGFIVAATGTGTILNDDVSRHSVTSVTPASGPAAGGTRVLISGQNFAAGCKVVFGGNAASGVEVVDAFRIYATTPAHEAGPVYVLVTCNGNDFNAAGAFTFDAPPMAATGITPPNGSASGGTAVTIAGSGFTSACNVWFGGTRAATTTYVSATSIVAVTAAHAAGPADVTVACGSEQSTLPKAFRFDAAAPARQRASRH